MMDDYLFKDAHERRDSYNFSHILIVARYGIDVAEEITEKVNPFVIVKKKLYPQTCLTADEKGLGASSTIQISDEF